MRAPNEQAILTAPDISCDHCVATVEGAVAAVDGVERVTASADTKQVVVTFDASRVTRDQIATALTDAGYPSQQ